MLRCCDFFATYPAVEIFFYGFDTFYLILIEYSSKSRKSKMRFKKNLLKSSLKKSKTVTAKDYMKMKKTDIKSAKFILPKLGKIDFGRFIISYEDYS